jgi:hypothetical protein
MMRRALLLAAAFAPAAGGAAQACDPPLQGAAIRVMRSGSHAVAWRAEPQPIAVGTHFAVELAVCAATGAGAFDTVAVDADMPEHRHGMNYRASVVALGQGRYRAEGLMFHMAGRWRLTVELRAAAAVERLTDEVTVD